MLLVYLDAGLVIAWHRSMLPVAHAGGTLLPGSYAFQPIWFYRGPLVLLPLHQEEFGLRQFPGIAAGLVFIEEVVDCVYCIYYVS